MIRRLTAIFLCCVLVLSLSACGTQSVGSPFPAPALPESIGQPIDNAPVFSESEPAALPDPVDELPSTDDYIRQVIREHTAKIEQPGMSEYDKVKAAADYVMSIGYYHRPVALDVWRWRTAGDTAPTYEEMRGLNMLLFGIETCEGYTASLNLLLEEMGIETRYMTGMTYLARGGLGYHSWSQVKIDGVWYHLDCELEDGIARNDGNVSYQYFLKSDATMSASHFWGQRLIDLGRLEPSQVEEVLAHYMGENCPQDYPTPAPSHIPVNPQPDADGLREKLSAELAEYEAHYGKLEYMELDILPPVFVRYYYRNGEPPEDATENIRNYRQVRLLIDPPGSPASDSNA